MSKIDEAVKQIISIRRILQSKNSEDFQNVARLTKKAPTYHLRLTTPKSELKSLKTTWVSKFHVMGGR
jgi:hypothetical protein